MLEKVSYKDIFAFAWSYWSRRKFLGTAAVGLMMLSTLSDAFVPFLSGQLVDSMTHSADAGKVKAQHFIILLMITIISVYIFRWAAFLFYNRWECYSMRDIVTDALNKVQLFSSDWHANNFAGGTVRKITRARTSFERFEDVLFLHIMPALVIMIGVSGMIMFALPQVGVFAVGLIVLYCAVSVFMSIKYLAPFYSAAARADTAVGAALADTITGNPTVKSHGAEDRENKIFFRVAQEWYYKTSRSYLANDTANLVRDMLGTVMLGGMLVITYIMWAEGNATPGSITLVITSFFTINGYLRDIGRQISDLQMAMSEMEDAVYFWKTDIAVRDRPGALDLKAAEGEIVFDRVDFSYGPRHKKIYDGFSLGIAPGEKVALVGHSGAGKSTFVKLVQRLYDIQGGEILIEGQNVAEVTQSSLRQTIALVPQEPVLFHRTLAENISYGRPGAAYEEIVEAARQAHAHNFIESLPDGYDTLVGERGIKLSGGERQRVAIARAILADAPILILDEATSSLDSLSEDVIQKALENLIKGRTTITIAHRLATIRTADRILVFDKGRVIEDGTHDELIQRRNSHYAKLWHMQSGGFLG